MIEKAGRIIKVDSRYALVQLTNKANTNDTGNTSNSFFTKLHAFIFTRRSTHSNTTIRARNSIYAQPNDTVIVGLPSQHPFNALMKQTGNCIDSSAIILRCTAPIADRYSSNRYS